MSVHTEMARAEPKGQTPGTCPAASLTNELPPVGSALATVCHKRASYDVLFVDFPDLEARHHVQQPSQTETRRHTGASLTPRTAMTVEVFSKPVDELSEPDAVLHTPLPRGPACKEVFARLNWAYPDFRIAVADLIAEGVKVVSRNAVTGTHLGE